MFVQVAIAAPSGISGLSAPQQLHLGNTEKFKQIEKLSQTLQLALHKVITPLYCDRKNYHLSYLEHGHLEAPPYMNTIDGLIPTKKSQNNKQTLASLLGNGKSDIHAFLLNIYQTRGQDVSKIANRDILFKIDKDYNSTNLQNLFICNGSEEISSLNNQLMQIFTELQDSGIVGFHPGSSNHGISAHYFIADPRLRKILLNLASNNKKIKRNNKLSLMQSEETIDGIIKKFDVNKKRKYKPGKAVVIRGSKLTQEIISSPKTHIHHINSNRNNGYPDNLYICDHQLHSQLHFQIDSILSFLIKKNIISFFPETVSEAKLSKEQNIPPHYFINLPYLRKKLEEPYPQPKSLKPFIELLSDS